MLPVDLLDDGITPLGGGVFFRHVPTARRNARAATRQRVKAQAAMSKNGIYLIGLAILGAVMGYFPDVFRDPVRFLAGAI